MSIFCRSREESTHNEIDLDLLFHSCQQQATASRTRVGMLRSNSHRRAHGGMDSLSAVSVNRRSIVAAA